MEYRSDKYGNPISQLAYGCMRFSAVGGHVDLAKAEAEVRAAIAAGVNYFDAAYAYPGIEDALGRILARDGLRARVNIATKLPHYLVRTPADFEKYFSEQLRRLRTDHVDYYLMHMLTDRSAWERLVSLGILDWLAEKKASGALRQIGFSYHGGTEEFCRLVDAYDWDFCMIQYNYLDENAQAGRRGLQYAHAKGLPVMIMEPLRGGRLAKGLPPAALRELQRHPVQHSPAQWALRWLWDQPEVTCVLSGMNSLAMLEDNVRAAEDARVGALTPEDQAMLRRVVAAINAKMKVGCTGCGYCMPCPRGVDIPGAFAAYNLRYSEGWISAEKGYLMCAGLRSVSTAASQCVGCGRCETHCPQQIAIRQELKNVRRTLEGPIFRAAVRLVRLFRKY